MPLPLTLTEPYWSFQLSFRFKVCLWWYLTRENKIALIKIKRNKNKAIFCEGHHHSFNYEKKLRLFRINSFIKTSCFKNSTSNMEWENCDEPENIEFEGNDIFLSRVHWVSLNFTAPCFHLFPQNRKKLEYRKIPGEIILDCSEKFLNSRKRFGK